MDNERIFQVVGRDSEGYPVLQSWHETATEAQTQLDDCNKFWPDDEWWIQEGTDLIMDKCKGCDALHASEQFDGHGITTGLWCDDCYNSDKYPYRKDKYPTMETHGYGEQLNDDY